MHSLSFRTKERMPAKTKTFGRLYLPSVFKGTLTKLPLVTHNRSDLPSMWPPPTYDIKLLKRQTPGLWFFPWGLFECIEWHSKCQAFLFGGPAWLGCPCVDEHYCFQVWLYLCSQDEVAWSHLRPPLGSGMIRMSHPTSLIRKPLELLAGWSCEWPHMKPGVLSNSFPC